MFCLRFVDIMWVCKLKIEALRMINKCKIHKSKGSQGSLPPGIFSENYPRGPGFGNT